MSDLLNTVLTGFCIGLSIIGLLNAYPGEPFKYDTNAVDDSGNDQQIPIAVEGEEKIVNSKKLQKLLGGSADELRSAIAQEREKSISQAESGLSMCRIIEYGAYLFLILILFFMINVWSNGEFGRIIAGALYSNLFFLQIAYFKKLSSMKYTNFFRTVSKRSRILGFR